MWIIVLWVKKIAVALATEAGRKFNEDNFDREYGPGASAEVRKLLLLKNPDWCEMYDTRGGFFEYGRKVSHFAILEALKKD